MTLAWVLSNTGWLWRVSRPRSSRCDILSASSFRSLRSWPGDGDIPGHAPGGIPLEAPPILPGILEEVRRRHQRRQWVLPIYYSWWNWHWLVLIICEQLCSNWITAGGEWRKSGEARLASLVPSRLGGERCCFFWLFWTFSSDRDRKLLACGGESHVSLVTRPSSENHWHWSCCAALGDWSRVIK